jgi:hypothetical protein
VTSIGKGNITVGLNDADGTGDTSPQGLFDRVDEDAAKEEHEFLGVFRGGARRGYTLPPVRNIGAESTQGGGT